MYKRHHRVYERLAHVLLVRFTHRRHQPGTRLQHKQQRLLLAATQQISAETLRVRTPQSMFGEHDPWKTQATTAVANNNNNKHYNNLSAANTSLAL